MRLFERVVMGSSADHQGGGGSDITCNCAKWTTRSCVVVNSAESRVMSEIAPFPGLSAPASGLSFARNARFWELAPMNALP